MDGLRNACAPSVARSATAQRNRVRETYGAQYTMLVRAMSSPTRTPMKERFVWPGLKPCFPAKMIGNAWNVR